MSAFSHLREEYFGAEPSQAGEGCDGAEPSAPGGRDGSVPLPCLSSHNSITLAEEAALFAHGEGLSGTLKAALFAHKEGPSGTLNQLRGTHQKTAHVLKTEIVSLASKYGIERLGFLTLTFAGKRTPPRAECNRRFNSLNTNLLKARYARAVGVWERSPTGRLHMHLVVVLPADIRTGFDFEALERKDYSSANPLLRAEWAFWRKMAPRYKFGRTELLPVKSTADGIAYYVGGYIQKNVLGRQEEDKGARLVRFIGYKPGERTASSRFSWVEGHSREWRLKVGAFARKNRIETMDMLKTVYGPRWAYFLQELIMSTPLPSADSPSCPVSLKARVGCSSEEHSGASVSVSGKILDEPQRKVYYLTYGTGSSV